MSMIPLKLPPGFFKNGTDYETKGRWFDGNLVRWFQTSLQPVGGWTPVTDTNDAAVTVALPIRGMLGWKSDSGISHLAMGSFCKAWAFVLGVLTEITPVGITCGTADATVINGGAYGKGNYGTGPYGGVVSDTKNQIVEAGSWQFDTFGQILVGNPWPDNKIYDWDLDVAHKFVAIVNAPTANAIVVTPERFLVALGAAGDRRLVQWSDQDARTVWGDTIENQAGNFPMPGAGDILAGRRGRNETLIWTETDVWAMRFIGGDLIYGFVQVGVDTGAISRHSMVMVGSRALWMGKRNFYQYDGFAKPLPSEVADFVFDDFNWTQASKVVAVPVAEFGEVTWYYPSAGSVENDRYVTFNFEMGIWYFGLLERTAGIDRGAHRWPIMVAANGKIYEHEKGTSYLSPAGTPIVPFAESGPVELGDGDQIMTVMYIVPDDKTVGDVNATLTMAFHPGGAETTFGPFTLSKQTSVRKTGRTIRLKLTQVNPNWRVGVPRLDVQPGGRR